jgi:hypothetical protein
MDNVQKHNTSINVPLSQTFRSYLGLVYSSSTLTMEAADFPEQFLFIYQTTWRYTKKKNLNLNLYVFNFGACY